MLRYYPNISDFRKLEEDAKMKLLQYIQQDIFRLRNWLKDALKRKTALILALETLPDDPFIDEGFQRSIGTQTSDADLEMCRRNFCTEYKEEMTEIKHEQADLIDELEPDLLAPKSSSEKRHKNENFSEASFKETSYEWEEDEKKVIIRESTEEDVEEVNYSIDYLEEFDEEVMQSLEECEVTLGKESYQVIVVKDSTDDELYTCEMCSTQFDTKLNLEKHLWTNHLSGDKWYFTCLLCGVSYKRWTVFNRHLDKHENVDEFPCDVCNQKFMSLKNFRIHRKVDHATEPFCDICHEKFVNSIALMDHKLHKHSSKKRFPCLACDQHFNSRRARVLHYDDQHSDLCTVSCHCGKTFGLKEDFEAHWFSQHEPGPYQCSVCFKKFKSSSRLNDHMYVHDGYKNFICHVCGKSYRTPNALKTHFKAHQERKKFNCQICNKVYESMTGLKYHMERHTGQPKFTCEICGKVAYNAASLGIHMRTHTNYRPYSCATCGVAYTVPIGLKKHMLTHTGERRYQCDVCMQRFYTSFDLNRHKTKHSLEKPFPCDECERGFTSKGAFLKHKESHKIITTFHCPKCNQHFALEEDIVKHKCQQSFVQSSCCDCGSIFYEESDILNHVCDKAQLSEKIYLS